MSWISKIYNYFGESWTSNHGVSGSEKHMQEYYRERQRYQEKHMQEYYERYNREIREYEDDRTLEYEEDCERKTQ